MVVLRESLSDILKIISARKDMVGLYTEFLEVFEINSKLKKTGYVRSRMLDNNLLMIQNESIIHRNYSYIP